MNRLTSAVSVLGVKLERITHREAPPVINTTDAKSYLVNSSPNSLFAKIELKTIVRDEVKLSVIISAKARLTIDNRYVSNLFLLRIMNLPLRGVLQALQVGIPLCIAK